MSKTVIGPDGREYTPDPNAEAFGDLMESDDFQAALKDTIKKWEDAGLIRRAEEEELIP